MYFNVDAVSQKGVAYLVDTQTLSFVWIVITIIGIFSIMGMYVLSLMDKKEYTLLYERN